MSWRPKAAAHARALAEVIGAANVSLVEDCRCVVARPGAASDVAAVLEVARASRLTVEVASRDRSPDVVLDLARMARVLHLDDCSLLVHVQAGSTLAQLEAGLGERRLSLGAALRWGGERTVGAALASPRPAEGGPCGRFLDACSAVDGVLADGTIFSTRMAPRRATGPDLAHALLGARGTTGVITAAWLRVTRRLPTRHAAFVFPDRAAPVAVARALLDRGLRPAQLSVTDRLDAAAGTVLALALDVPSEVCDAAVGLAADLATSAGGRPWPAVATLEEWLARPCLPDLRRQRFVPWRELDAAWAACPAPAELTAFSPAGAALVAESVTPAAPVFPSPTRAAILHQLDPQGLFSRPERTA